MKEFVIYLAGQMSGISYEESNRWRLVAKDCLENVECDYKVKAINPNDYYNFKEKTYINDKEIIRLDLHKVRTSDLILVDLSGKSIGTAMEIQHAFDRGIPIVGFTSGDKSEIHPWLEFECDRVFGSIQGALEYIENYHLK